MSYNSIDLVVNAYPDSHPDSYPDSHPDLQKTQQHKNSVTQKKREAIAPLFFGSVKIKALLSILRV